MGMNIEYEDIYEAHSPLYDNPPFLSCMIPKPTVLVSFLFNHIFTVVYLFRFR